MDEVGVTVSAPGGRHDSLHNDRFPIRRAMPSRTTSTTTSPEKIQSESASYPHRSEGRDDGKNDEGGKERKGEGIDGVRRETKERA